MRTSEKDAPKIQSVEPVAITIEHEDKEHIMSHIINHGISSHISQDRNMMVKRPFQPINTLSLVLSRAAVKIQERAYTTKNISQGHSHQYPFIKALTAGHCREKALRM